MNICLVSREYPWRRPCGGVGVYTASLAVALAEAGQHVTVITQSPDAKPREETLADVRIVGTPFSPYPALPRRLAMFSSLSTITWSRTVVRVFRAAVPDADVIEGPAMAGEVLGLQSLARRPPVVVRMHGGTTLDLKARGAFRGYHYPVLWRERRSIIRADTLTAVSDAIRRNNETLFGITIPQAIVTPNPVDLRKFSPAAGDANRSEPRILFVGRLDSVKGFDLMPEIVVSTLTRCPRARFVFAGAVRPCVSSQAPQDSKSFLLSRIPEAMAARVQFVGEISGDAMVALYRGGYALVAPSRREALSLAALEAASSGLPVVGALDTGMEEAVEPNVTGYLEPVDRPQDFANRLVELIDNPGRAREMGVAGRARTERLYGFLPAAQAALKVYAGAVSALDRSV